MLQLRIFNIANKFFNVIRENKIHAKIFEFTVAKTMIALLNVSLGQTNRAPECYKHFEIFAVTLLIFPALNI